MLIKKNKQQAGLSIIEIIIAVAIFIIIASGSLVTILGSFSINRLGAEQAQASFLSLEGLEAVESIRNQGWNNITNGTYGLIQTNGVWSFSGSSDTDQSGRYTRVITISDVRRDTNQDIVTSGGAIDSQTKIITSTVSWDFTPSKNSSVQKEAYLTNWQRSTNQEGIIVEP